MDLDVPGAGLASQQKGQTKALRFVTNYGAPHPKRRRIGAACLTCRKRKTACSGEKPTCETCKQNRLDCAGYNPDNTTSPGPKRVNLDHNARAELDSEAAHKTDLADANLSATKKKERDTVHRHSSSDLPPESDAHSFPQSRRPAQRNTPDRPLFSGPRNRMPYFRWLGPTAIMPGFKQMVVKVRRAETDVARSSTDGMRSPSAGHLHVGNSVTAFPSGPPTAVESDVRTPLTLPFYDTSPMPPSELITHLANTFFIHLGCNYPFLQRERFLRDLDEKQVDAILIDAVCALAARFSTHSLLKQQPASDDQKLSPADYGHAFAVRAKASLVDTFACPSVAAVQAALLLAYNEFGESRDSGLWMYLGIAIRMAQDLGMHKLEGLRYKGRDGPTPKEVKLATRRTERATESNRSQIGTSRQPSSEDDLTVDEQKAVEQERVDTFWAVFFLDRMVSSGTGRRSTLRDNEIELSFPSLDDVDEKSGWPAPFPALIRIVHLYGRVADLLNSIKEPSDVTSDTPKRLGAMENQVTQFYQGLSSRLHFDAINFQHYMKAGEGTNFVLLHFWFHTLIVLLHRPTLLKTFEGNMLQLFPNSQQLSMSSAKTIADILSYSQLMDAKASLGNPFTSQPIYIAACAFLKETAEQTATSNAQSRSNSPTRPFQTSDASTDIGATPKDGKRLSISDVVATSKKVPINALEQKTLAKHTLLATAANQHYQLCYKALQSLETYWSGAKYILTVLDQKFEGVGDPLLYTVEEGESSMERPRPEPAFTSPGWRRKLSWETHAGGPPNSLFAARGFSQVPGSPVVDPSKAIGWTLTGTMDSGSTNLAWHYPSNIETTNGVMTASNSSTQRKAIYDNDPTKSRGTGHESVRNPMYPQHLRADGRNSRVTTSADAPSRPPMPAFHRSSSTVSTADADLLLALNSPFQTSSANAGTTAGDIATYHQAASSDTNHLQVNNFSGYVNFPMAPFALSSPLNFQNFGDMEIAPVNDVDMSALGLDMMPWFDSYTCTGQGQPMYANGMYDPVTDAQLGNPIISGGNGIPDGKGMDSTSPAQ